MYKLKVMVFSLSCACVGYTQARTYVADTSYDYDLGTLQVRQQEWTNYHNNPNNHPKPPTYKCPLRGAIESAKYADSGQDKYPDICPDKDAITLAPKIYSLDNQHTVVLQDARTYEVNPDYGPINISVPIANAGNGGPVADADGSLVIRLVTSDSTIYPWLVNTWITGAVDTMFDKPGSQWKDSELIEINGNNAKELVVDFFGIGLKNGYTSGRGSALYMHGSINENNELNTLVRFNYGQIVNNYAESGGPVYNEGVKFYFFQSWAIGNHAEHPIYKGEVNRSANDRDQILGNATEINQNRPKIWEILGASRGGFYVQTSNGEGTFEGDPIEVGGSRVNQIGPSSPFDALYKARFVANHAHRDGGVFYCTSGSIKLNYILAEENLAGNPDDNFAVNNKGLEPKGDGVTASTSLGGGVLAVDGDCDASMLGSELKLNFSYKSSAIATNPATFLYMYKSSVHDNKAFFRDYFLEFPQNTFNRSGAAVTVKGGAVIDSSTFDLNEGGVPSAIKVENIGEKFFSLTNTTMSHNVSGAITYSAKRKIFTTIQNSNDAKIPPYTLIDMGPDENSDIDPFESAFIQTYGSTIMFKGIVSRLAQDEGKYRATSGSKVIHNSFERNVDKYALMAVSDSSGTPEKIYVVNNLFSLMPDKEEINSGPEACDGSGAFLGSIVPEFLGNVESPWPKITCPSSAYIPFTFSKSPLGTQHGIALIPSSNILTSGLLTDALACKDFSKDQVNVTRPLECISGAIHVNKSDCEKTFPGLCANDN